MLVCYQRALATWAPLIELLSFPDLDIILRLLILCNGNYNHQIKETIGGNCLDTVFSKLDFLDLSRSAPLMTGEVPICSLWVWPRLSPQDGLLVLTDLDISMVEPIGGRFLLYLNLPRRDLLENLTWRTRQQLLAAPRMAGLTFSSSYHIIWCLYF